MVSGSVGLDGPGVPGPGLKRNRLRLEVGVVFQKLPLAGEARPLDKPVFARESRRYLKPPPSP